MDQWRQRLANFGRMDCRKGEGIQGLGTQVTQWGPGRRPNRGSSGQISQADTYFGKWPDVKLIFYGGKIENAYISRCFLKERMLQSCRYTIIDIYVRLLCNMSIMSS